VNPELGNRKPVALVSTVVSRKMAVNPLRRFDFNMAANTTSPVAMAIRLMTTCTVVNAGIDIPKIIDGSLSASWNFTPPRFRVPCIAKRKKDASTGSEASCLWRAALRGKGAR
jgi:hypothetical protein